MDLTDCVLTRKSVRAYQPTPVPRELLTKILAEARYCASTANTQSWEFAVFGGQVMEEMRKACQEHFLAGVTPSPDIPYDPTAWPEPYGTRRALSGKRYFEACGIPKTDEGRQRFALKGYTFFGAPNGIIIYIDSILGSFTPWSMLDVGAILQTILLLAHNYGLGCCPQIQMVFYPDIIRKLMNIPSSKKIVVGLCIGYPDWDDPLNKPKTDRLPLEEMVSWHGI